MEINLNKIVIFCALFFGGLSFACGQNMDDSAVTKKVSFQEQLEILEVIKGDDKSAQEKIFQQISNHPDTYIPPVLHRYAGTLFEYGKSKKGWFWHFVAELRGRIDANLTTYEEAMQFVSFISSINAAKISSEDRFKNLEQLEKTVEKVVNYVRNKSVSYDRNWIVLLKFKAEPVDGQEVDMKINLMEPKNKWETIKQNTIDEYYRNFQKYTEKEKQGNTKMRVTAVPFNYTPYEIGKIQVNGTPILGVFSAADEYGPGGGGGTHSGLLFNPGPVTIKWMIGGVEGQDPNAGEYRTAEGIIPKAPKKNKNWKSIYLGVHIYRDSVRFTLTSHLPSALEQEPERDHESGEESENYK